MAEAAHHEEEVLGKAYDARLMHRLLAYLGVSGERTDVLAHVCGLVWGLILGVFLPELLARGALRRSVQLACGIAALFMIALAWGLALRTAPA